MAANDLYNVKVLEKAINIMNCFTPIKPEWTINEFCRELDLNRTTVYRILSTLSAHDYVYCAEDTGKYKLGRAIIKLGGVIFNEKNLQENAQKFLQELSERTGETAHLAIYNHDFTATIIAKYDSMQEVKATRPIGTSFPLHANSMGKIFLASLPAKAKETYLAAGLTRFTKFTATTKERVLDILHQVSSDKVAYDLGEVSDDTFGIGAPILNYDQKIIAAISLVGPRFRMEHNLAPFAAVVKDAAFHLSKEMGYIGTPW